MTGELLEEWINKAEEDYQVVLQLHRRRKTPMYNTVCFHSQQCAEKYLKAFLVRQNIPFKKTHELGELSELAKQVDDTFKLIDPVAAILTPYAISFRYPGENANEEEAREAVAAMKEVRKFVRARLGLK